MVSDIRLTSTYKFGFITKTLDSSISVVELCGKVCGQDNPSGGLISKRSIRPLAPSRDISSSTDHVSSGGMRDEIAATAASVRQAGERVAQMGNLGNAEFY